MIPIYICEKDPRQLEIITTVIKNQITLEDLNSQVAVSSTDPNELLKIARRRTADFGIYFLDTEIQSHELTGITLGKEIRQMDPLGKIIYVTANSDFSLEILKNRIEPTDYILKEDVFELKDRLEHILSKIVLNFHNSQPQKDIFKLEFNGEIKFLPLDEIQYFSTSAVTPHKLEVHMTHAHLQFYDKIKDIEKKNNYFIRCHKSYVINKLNIRTIDKKKREVTLANGETVPISIRGLKKIIS
ncbi:LytTR family DNA-binding domain-containing protein [Enterococcus thailandicus]|uniref:LytR/AlgR family response regulator transcription factor n=1 Tax=Enterococcus thailandicus TaxID=417368 RepID=UPI00288F9E53|nr:LytTR family DNA-binding domain-containing protein [Enterococcus thailandicus]MDT2751666.1 LytTR family DNA-binding domain-containing protein [Enterococcus thailandicus]MDT2776226.1 LytTR family DNA-binding domain-containing protein [Enterococcus thailandicus]